ncbi:carbon-monoxide dehydrogenase medium subunit [Rhizobium sp. SG_E_25_P2]|jgi:aerobic carbon-monoxide dehydrogenase medium subunit|uniref:FAD binding domain-containing protein n=1 Tax=Rhizobium sp. SG_E_25_P2 TaxID=2879942 RepID=UPI002477197B|nr:FAD binding domain-containing protein [Rhizobium sp. SG_E_25_P2]MDH6269565.1 carbon-monoxide dehydrogenase medium subunit [Rhizobium sp. SG_E_25_P2]
MLPFNLHRPTAIDSIQSTLAGATDPKFLAGGMTLLPSMKLGLIAPTDLIDFTALPGIAEISSKDRTVTIGAAATHAAVARDSTVGNLCPALGRLAGKIGDRHVRNRGTIGGSVANNDPAADYPAAILALGATIRTDKREMAAEDFFLGIFETALEEHELITSFEFETPEQAAYAKFPHPASGYALAGVFICRTGSSVRVAVTGAGSEGAFRLTELEALLEEDFSAETADRVDLSSFDFFEDRNGSRAYRENLVRVMARRAISEIAGKNAA